MESTRITAMTLQFSVISSFVTGFRSRSVLDFFVRSLTLENRESYRVFPFLFPDIIFAYSVGPFVSSSGCHRHPPSFSSCMVSFSMIKYSSSRCSLQIFIISLNL